MGEVSPLIPKEYIDYFVKILPGNFYVDIFLLYLIPILAMILILLIAPLFLILLFQIHRLSTKIYPYLEYGIVRTGKDISGITLFKRALIVTLFSFSIVSIIVQTGHITIFRYIPKGESTIVLHEAEAIFLGTFLLTGFVSLIFIPLWLLEDSGIVFCKYKKENRAAPDLENIAGFFTKALEGYAGISTIIYLVLITKDCFKYVFDNGDYAPLLTPIILIFLPFLVTGLLSIPLIIYEKLLPKVRAKFHSKLEKKEVPYIIFPDFQSLKEGKEMIVGTKLPIDDELISEK